MLDLLQILGSETNLPLTLLLCGVALILVNVLTHRLVDYYKVRTQQREQFHRNLKPLLRATADLISRIVEILITEKDSTAAAIRAYTPAALEARIPTLTTAAGLNRHESTAYRLINFLALANEFSRQTSELPPFPLLDRTEFFLQHKIAVGLRGNLYDMQFLGTEVQEDVATSYLDCHPGRKAVDLSVGVFLRCLIEGRYDRDLYKKALDFFALQPPSFTGEVHMDRSSHVWRHSLIMAHLAIYLIDFYQELAVDPQWEESRVFFVRLVKQWNADELKHRYLYEPGDLNGTDYVDTFPSRRTSRQSSIRFMPSLFGMRDALSRARRWAALNYRGSRFGRRHHPKRISSAGVHINVGDNVFDIRWTDDLSGVHSSVRAYLRVRLLKM